MRGIASTGAEFALDSIEIILPFRGYGVAIFEIRFVQAFDKSGVAAV
jgi:hypothetical protein